MQMHCIMWQRAITAANQLMLTYGDYPVLPDPSVIQEASKVKKGIRKEVKIRGDVTVDLNVTF